ncbi:MAG: hypothetical protein JW976_08060 [Syntrophaceae bacterium]|nr:hypothetical protein [Syntrophaceae bacterium]
MKKAATFDPQDMNQCKQCITGYQKMKPDYELLAEYLQALFELIAKKLDIYPIIQGRAKSVESLAEKICRPGKNYSKPLAELTDLCGVRFITHTADDLDRVQGILEKYFIIDTKNSEDKMSQLSFNEFGYLSRHFIIQLKKYFKIRGFRKKLPPRILNFKSELQLRTLAQHMWADIYHELGYKNEFKLPQRWEREFARIAATLEKVDNSFQEIKGDIDVLGSNYEAYMDRKELNALAARLEVLLQIDRKNVQVLHRLIKTYMALNNWDLIEKHYRNQKTLAMTKAAVIRDIGMSLCKKYRDDPGKYTEGQSLLQKAVEINGNDVEALCNLAGTYFKKRGDDPDNLSKARDNYKRAHYIAPENPYPLGNYIACELILKKEPAIIEYFKPLIERTLHLCHKQIEVKTNLPWACYDLGTFNLYLNRPYESLKYYAKAIKTSSESWMVETGRSRIQEFIDAGIKLEWSEMVNTFLKIGELVLASTQHRKKSVFLTKHSGNPFLQSKRTGPSLKSVLIITGGCGKLEEHYRDQLQIFSKKLGCLEEGILISGGTCSGVAAIAGLLQKNNHKLYTIGYLPAKNAVRRLGEQIDRRYKLHRHTEGNDFTFLEPITFWLDFLCAGGNPALVKLIGFNGGQISACEYATALAFGAKVGIVRNSGREADNLLSDSFWMGYKNQKETKNKDKHNLYMLGLEDSSIESFLAM